MDQNQNQDWKKNPRLQNMDPSKLDMLQNMADQGTGKSPSELLPFLMAAASGDKSQGMNFSESETDAIIQVLTAGKSPAEMAKINRMIQLMKMMKK